LTKKQRCRQEIFYQGRDVLTLSDAKALPGVVKNNQSVYIARHQEAAGESSVSVVAGVRTVTTYMISAARLQDAPRFSLLDGFTESVNPQIQIRPSSVKLHLQL